jgi:hypothetical protein
MMKRWSSTPEPVREIVDVEGKPFSFLDQERLRPSRIEIFPGETEQLDIAVKLDADTECYGWNNDAYLHGWRPPHWKLTAGRYLVRVKVTSSGQAWDTVLLLINDVPRTDFRLEAASSDECRKVRLYGN